MHTCAESTQKRNGGLGRRFGGDDIAWARMGTAGGKRRKRPLIGKSPRCVMTRAADVGRHSRGGFAVCPVPSFLEVQACPTAIPRSVAGEARDFHIVVPAGWRIRTIGVNLKLTM